VIQIKTLLKHMAEDPTYLYYTVSNLLEFGEGKQPDGITINCSVFDDFLEKRGLFSWESAENKFNQYQTDPAGWRERNFKPKTKRDTLPKAQQFIEAAFKAGYFLEATTCKEVLRVTQRNDYQS
jgi:hypothetical protein